MTTYNQDFLHQSLFEHKPREYIIKDKNHLTKQQIHAFLNKKRVYGSFSTRDSSFGATFTFEVENSQDSIEAMNRLLSRGSCIAVHTKHTSLDYPVTILPLLAPKCLLFTIHPHNPNQFWNEQQAILPHNVQILPLPQQHHPHASIVIFDDNETTKSVHASFSKPNVQPSNQPNFARVFAKPVHFHNRIEMTINLNFHPSNNLSCNDKASIVNSLNHSISHHITRRLQPRFPAIQAKAMLEWRNIQNAFKSTHSSSEGDEARPESTAKKPHFTVRLTPTLLAQTHINQIAQILNPGFSVFTSLGDKASAVPVSFQFVRIIPPELVSDTLSNRTPQPSSRTLNPHSTSPIQFSHANPPPATPIINLPPSINYPPSRNISVPPPFSVHPNPSSPPPPHFRNISPPTSTSVSISDSPLLPTPNSSRTNSIPPPSQPLLSSSQSSHSSISSFSNGPAPSLNKHAQQFVPRLFTNTPPSNTLTSPTIPHSAVTLPSLFPNHLSHFRFSPSTIHPQNSSTPIAAPSVVLDGNPLDDEWEILSLVDDLDTLCLENDDFRGAVLCGVESDGREQFEVEAENQNKSDLFCFSSPNSDCSCIWEEYGDDLRDSDAGECDSQNDELGDSK
ncbi:hypothetical protein BLNAU_19008 [Blattamonas nauphoetae]|uniref:Uncharacterized protein n=1 Tax=Blattamonas nauphoetae TaxID=2049346 RepID=A0ABQ9X2Q3_9EUKA|nr:hypothetical protein BLNAU_19008 [Blattamonas nauphoetae]